MGSGGEEGGSTLDFLDGLLSRNADSDCFRDDALFQAERQQDVGRLGLIGGARGTQAKGHLVAHGSEERTAVRSP